MRVFISWSGERSRHIAAALRDWLPMVVQSSEPWMSQHDIGAGTRWFDEISKVLADPATRSGIICLTPENLNARWLHFEAGALARTLDAKTSVCPYVLELNPSQVEPPLGAFNGTKVDREGTWSLVKMVNSVEEKPLASVLLERMFDTMWPQLDEQFKKVPVAPAARTAVEPPRSPESMFEEILQILRSQAKLPGGAPATPTESAVPAVIEVPVPLALPPARGSSAEELHRYIRRWFDGILERGATSVSLLPTTSGTRLIAKTHGGIIDGASLQVPVHMTASDFAEQIIGKVLRHHLAARSDGSEVVLG